MNDPEIINGYELYVDRSYYSMWAVRKVGQKSFIHTEHFYTKDAALRFINETAENHDDKWLIKKCEQYSERYIANEKFLLEYSKLSFWTRLFKGRKLIREHLQSILKKYTH